MFFVKPFSFPCPSRQRFEEALSRVAKDAQGRPKYIRDHVHETLNRLEWERGKVFFSRGCQADPWILARAVSLMIPEGEHLVLCVYRNGDGEDKEVVWIVEKERYIRRVLWTSTK